MALVIDLPPELERRLEQEAARRGQSATEFARSVLEDQLTGVTLQPPLLPDGLPPDTPAELLAIAREQGVKPVQDPSELLGDFWPEDEDVDDFLEARRRWQREGGPGFPYDDPGLLRPGA